MSEKDVKEEEIIQEDFKKAKEIYDRIKKKYEFNHMPEILFALCLLYSRLMRHHKYEEWMQGRRSD
uniref:Uncharacterized protein n=1 Tax=viral metagenome TaxID=1070528 RepID=A0A6H1ZYT1_9ZZZZ